MDLREINFEQIPLLLDFAYKYGITFYDATYLALANFENIEFYTADDKLLGKVSRLARHIKEYV
jgi:predicted nucleic acid-binding protein